METATWFDVASDYGVLELHEELTAPRPALLLHLVIDSEMRRSERLNVIVF